MENFLSTLYLCYKELDKRFAVVHSKKITKKARIEATVLNSLTPLSKAEICKILPDVSPTTVEAVLGAMVKNLPTGNATYHAGDQVSQEGKSLHIFLFRGFSTTA